MQNTKVDVAGLSFKKTNGGIDGYPAIFCLASFSATRTPGSAGESKKNYIEKRPSGIMKERSANCTNKIRGGLFRWKKT